MPRVRGPAVGGASLSSFYGLARLVLASLFLPFYLICLAGLIWLDLARLWLALAGFYWL